MKENHIRKVWKSEKRKVKNIRKNNFDKELCKAKNYKNSCAEMTKLYNKIKFEIWNYFLKIMDIRFQLYSKIIYQS